MSKETKEQTTNPTSQKSSTNKEYKYNIISAFYAPNCEFEDPLVIVKGTKNVQAQVKHLISIFKPSFT
jgi:hypothetical protein